MRGTARSQGPRTGGKKHGWTSIVFNTCTSVQQATLMPAAGGARRRGFLKRSCKAVSAIVNSLLSVAWLWDWFWLFNCLTDLLIDWLTDALVAPVIFAAVKVFLIDWLTDTLVAPVIFGAVKVFPIDWITDLSRFRQEISAQSFVSFTTPSSKNRQNGRTALYCTTLIETLPPFVLQRTSVHRSRFLRVRPSSGIGAERICHRQRLEG